MINNSGEYSPGRYAKLKSLFAEHPDDLRPEVAKIALVPDVPLSTKVQFFMLQSLDGTRHLEQWCPHHLLISLMLVFQPSMLFKDIPFPDFFKCVQLFDKASTEDTLNKIVSPVARSVSEAYVSLSSLAIDPDASDCVEGFFQELVLLGIEYPTRPKLCLLLRTT